MYPGSWVQISQPTARMMKLFTYRVWQTGIAMRSDDLIQLLRTCLTHSKQWLTYSCYYSHPISPQRRPGLGDFGKLFISRLCICFFRERWMYTRGGRRALNHSQGRSKAPETGSGAGGWVGFSLRPIRVLSRPSPRAQPS